MQLGQILGEGDGAVLMGAAASRVLVAVLSNPPVTDGKRTLRRVALAADLLRFDEVEVVNLFFVPSYRTGAISTLGAAEEQWIEARPEIDRALGKASGVLRAYGTTAPVGAARGHFRRQVEWLDHRLAVEALPAWQVGDGPRHPSRWQRWTSRAHPEVPFADAVRSSLIRVQADSSGVAHYVLGAQAAVPGVSLNRVVSD